MSTLFLCGSTNSEGVRLARNVQRATGRWDRLVLLDDDAKRWGKEVVEVPVVGGFAELARAQPGDEAVNLVTRTTRGRAKAAERIAGFGVPVASLVAADVDTLGVDLAEGVTIYPQAMVCAGASVGAGSVVLMRAVVGHGAKVAEGCVVAVGAVLNARVELAPRVYVGTNASVLPDVRVGADATIGANTSVIDDVPDGATVVGVPGQVVDCAFTTTRDVAEPAEEAIDLELEGRILDVWSTLLEREDLSVHDNFFDAGGTSLLALQLVRHIAEAVGRPLPATQVFRYPTVRAFTAALAAPREVPAPRAVSRRAARILQRRG
ncbi:MAG: phosphopantetheine-binding protein [Sandaracinaceae bacterium]